MNAAARLVCDLSSRDHVTPALQSHHWLPIKQRIQFKLFLLVHLAISLLTAKHPSTSQRSSLKQHQLLVEPPIALLKIIIWSFNGQNLNSANELFPSPDLASGISYQQN